MSKRITLEEVYMRFAFLLAERSTCKRLQVGCVIVSADFEQVYAIGYNGNAKGLPNTCDNDRAGNCRCIHAKVNALVKCPVKDKNKAMFVTDTPCLMCAKLIINSGFSCVYYNRVYRDKSGYLLLKDTGIKVKQVLL